MREREEGARDLGVLIHSQGAAGACHGDGGSRPRLCQKAEEEEREKESPLKNKIFTGRSLAEEKMAEKKSFGDLFGRIWKHKNHCWKAYEKCGSTMCWFEICEEVCNSNLCLQD